jgi:predicted enzyme related to lactoylglutathione lyase
VTELSSRPPGTFSWAELATTNQDAGVAFYRALFGWDVSDSPMGPNQTYSMFMLRGKPVAAAYTMHGEERQSGAPPNWHMYISVANADEAARRAESLGAKILVPAFDVMEVGRMAVVQDPSGAVFCAWQPKQHQGAAIVNEPGALCWSELTTRDAQAAEAFYTRMFGWTAKRAHPVDTTIYTEFLSDGQPGVGMMPMPAHAPAQMPSFWMPYFQVTNCEGSVATAKKLGGSLMVGPDDIPKTGRFAILRDPQGAVFAVFQRA